MNHPFVPPDATLEELERTAANCEKLAKIEQGPIADKLREEARFYREWIAKLRSGKWTAQ